MSKHIIIAGHGDGDPGASGYYKSERASIIDMVDAIRQVIAKYNLEKKFEIIDSFNVYKRNDFAKNQAKYKKAKTVTEIHLNAFNKESRGAEIIFGAGFKPDAYDVRLEKMLRKYFTWRRYIASDNYQNPREAKRRGINYRLIEYAFCDNKKDIDIYNKNLEKLALETVEALLNKDLGEPPTTTKPLGKLYTVQIGAFKNKENAERQLKKAKKHFPDAFIK